jgi:hypothetical protein
MGLIIPGSWVRAPPAPLSRSTTGESPAHPWVKDPAYLAVRRAEQSDLARTALVEQGTGDWNPADATISARWAALGRGGSCSNPRTSTPMESTQPWADPLVIPRTPRHSGVPAEAEAARRGVTSGCGSHPPNPSGTPARDGRSGAAAPRLTRRVRKFAADKLHAALAVTCS